MQGTTVKMKYRNLWLLLYLTHYMYGIFCNQDGSCMWNEVATSISPGHFYHKILKKPLREMDFCLVNSFKLVNIIFMVLTIEW